jgi:8-oxo-dGTP pyrophosphatase MutT (NUDIX family)
VDFSDGVSNRKWELVQRTTRNANAPDDPNHHPVDAVDLCALLYHQAPSRALELIVVSQHRPPCDAVVVEFPAGLIDPGESPIDAALRELREETGFTVKDSDRPRVEASPVLCYEPGITDSCFHLVTVMVDAALPQNIDPQQQLEEGEDIAVHRLLVREHDGRPPAIPPLHQLKLLAKSLGPRAIVDGKLYTYVCGLSSSFPGAVGGCFK